MKLDRRKFVQTVGTLGMMAPLSSLASSMMFTTGKRNPKIILRTAWQTVNIGDIGHTLGLLELLKNYLPEAEITIWPFRELDMEVDRLVRKKFKQVKIISGKIDAVSKQPDSAELKHAFDTIDILVHSSGSGFVAKNDVQAWSDLTKKPFGVYGVSLSYIDKSHLDLINKASFFYTRDTASLDHLLSLRPTCPIVEFAPDATFAIEVVDQAQTEAYLKETGLSAGKYICVIPRLRYTPYWQIRNTVPTEDEKGKYAVSQFYKEADHEKLREVIIRWVRETGLKVLVCPEVTYQVELGKEVLVDPLPEDVKKNVVWRNTYWLPDLAQGVYAQARALVCFEPHSPIMALNKGVPSMYLRQPTDTRKGQMWRDIGLNEWIFEIDITAGSQIFDAVKEVHQNYDRALQKVKKAQLFIKKRQNISMEKLKQTAYNVQK